MFKRMLVLAACLAAPSARAEFVDHLAVLTDVGENKAPRFGRSRLLVLPVEAREIGQPSLDRAAIEEFFTGESSTDLRFRSYFDVASNGRFAPEVEVAPTLVLQGCPAGLNEDCSLSSGDLNVLREAGIGLLRTVFDRADRGCWEARDTCDGATAIDFSKYDLNGLHGASDGFIDGVMLVTNLPGVSVSLPISALNPAGADDLADGRGGAFLLDDTKIPAVALCGAEPDDVSRANRLCLRLFANLLGLANLGQEFAYRQSNPQKEYAGLQCSALGAWDHDASAPMLDAESRYRLGWTDVEVVSGKKTITLAPAAAGGGIVKLGVQTDTRREYYLVEARGPVGPYDRNLVRTTDRAAVFGLAVYRVNWNEGPSGQPGTWITQLLDCPNCDPWRAFVSNVQGDRRWELQHGSAFRPEEDLFQDGDAIESLRDETPFGPDAPFGTNWTDGTPSGIAIRNVRVAANGDVTAEFEAPEVQNACADVTCAPGYECHEGNCRLPTEPEEPGPIIKPQPQSPATAEDGWGCTTGPAGLLALLALALRRTKPVA